MQRTQKRKSEMRGQEAGYTWGTAGAKQSARGPRESSRGFPDGVQPGMRRGIQQGTGVAGQRENESVNKKKITADRWGGVSRLHHKLTGSTVIVGFVASSGTVQAARFRRKGQLVSIGPVARGKGKNGSWWSSAALGMVGWNCGSVKMTRKMGRKITLSLSPHRCTRTSAACVLYCCCPSSRKTTQIELNN
jgi:hypothetical protein